MSRKYNITMLSVIILCVFIQTRLNAQMNMTVNSLADDEYSYAWDDPNTPQDESTDGICEDELGRCTIRAALDESSNMDIPVDLDFSVSGTITLTEALYPINGCVINGGRQITMTAPNFVDCFELDNNTELSGIMFDNLFAAVYVWGSHNKIGGVLNGNVFTNCYVALEIDGDSNQVISNYFGIDTNKVLMANQVSIMLLGNYNEIGRSAATYSNTICGSGIAGISLNEGSYNSIKYNFIGTTSEGDVGLGNTEGILIAGSTYNTIGGDNSTDGNIISGNSIDGISISGVPPDNNSDVNIIKNNIIGLNVSQSSAIPNGNGITLTNGVWSCYIEDNVIAGNSQNGVNIFGYDADSRNSLCDIENNRIGVNSGGSIFPNGSSGILISGNCDKINVGTDEGGSFQPNILVGNSGSGLKVETNYGFSPSKIVFRKNKIYLNSTSNLFVSPQANDGIQPPYSLSFSNNTIAGIEDVPGAIIDIYKADINEFAPSAYTWLGSTTVGSNGVFSYEITDPTVEAVSMTATKGDGSTSGFGYLELITGVKNDDNEIPSVFALRQNYPNPFNPSTTIKFSLPRSEYVSLKVFSLLGEEVGELVNEIRPAGNYAVTFNADKLSSGVYMYRIQAGKYIRTNKMIVLK